MKRVSRDQLTIILIFLISLIFHCDADAVIHQSVSCSSGDIQAAISKASDGDSVYVPACDSGSWSSNVEIPNTKGITLQGSGSSSTIIRLNGYTLAAETRSTSQKVRITGFNFIHTDTENAIRITGSGTNWRIDNNIFDSNNVYGTYSIRIGDMSANTDSFTYGVIDNNQFINRNYATSIFVEWPRGDLDTIAPGDWVWSQMPQRGTAQAVYIEDNVFSGSGEASQSVDSRWGAKYVFRYNRVHNPWITTHSGKTNLGREPIWTEVYKNIFTEDGQRYGGDIIWLRSSSGVVWANSSSQPLNKFGIGIDHERSSSGGSGPYGAVCDGTQAFDENSAYNGWRCLGQPGWGPPQASNMTNYSFAGVFAWGNLNAGAEVNMSLVSTGGYTVQHLVFSRELFNSANMKIGGSQPATCSSGSDNRDVWIDTASPDSPKLFICRDTNVWTKHWEPFAYPHPIRVGDGSPAIPMNLKLISNR